MSLRVIFIIYLVTTLSLIGCGQPSDQSSTANIALNTNLYVKSNVSINLPEDWEVIEDFKIGPYRRRINIITDLGSTVTIDLYRQTEEHQIPSLQNHIANYVSANTPPEIDKEASIDYGTVGRGDHKGMFVDLTVGEPYNIHSFIEAYRIDTYKASALIIFSTKFEQKELISKNIDVFLQSETMKF